MNYLPEAAISLGEVRCSVFVQQLGQFADPGDLVIGISGSGNNRNVLSAVEWAGRHELITFGITGFDGGRLWDAQQEGINIALADMGMVESIHLVLLHWVVEEVHARINGTGRYTDRSYPQ